MSASDPGWQRVINFRHSFELTFKLKVKSVRGRLLYILKLWRKKKNELLVQALPVQAMRTSTLEPEPEPEPSEPLHFARSRSRSRSRRKVLLGAGAGAGAGVLPRSRSRSRSRPKMSRLRIPGLRDQKLKIPKTRDSYLVELVILRHLVFFICSFIQKCVIHRPANFGQFWTKSCV